MSKTTGQDELFKVSGDSQAVNVEAAQRSPEDHSPAPPVDDVAVLEQLSTVADQPTPASVDEVKVDTEMTPLQQRIAKVKRRSADISEQLETLTFAPQGPTDISSE